jgi:type I restriction enzyme M protein
VLFLSKHASASNGRPPKTRIAVAIHCGHDRRGRTHGMDGKPLQDDFASIADEHGSTSRNVRWWSSVSLNGSDYVVPRYLAKDRVASLGDDEITSTAPRATIGKLVQDGVLSIKKGHEVGSHAYGTGDIPFIRTSDITNFEISVDPTKSVSEEIYNEYARQQRLRAGDIVMVVDGRYRIGATAMLSSDNCRAVVQSHLRIISVRKPDVVNPHALVFALNLPSVKIRLRDLVFVQSTLGTLGARLLELEVPVLGPIGPWSQRVGRFEALLRQREESLTELRRMAGTDVEL